MSEASTDRYQSLLRLTESQVRAVDTLDAGSTHAEAAQAAGVNRVTVTRWVHHHPEFKAELNRRRLERLEIVSARSEGVTDRAIDVVGQAIDEGNVGTALAWLRMTLTPSWSMPRNGTSSLKPLTATEIIAHAAELVAMHEPMQALTAIYRQEAIDQIHEALATSD